VTGEILVLKVRRAVEPEVHRALGACHGQKQLPLQIDHVSGQVGQSLRADLGCSNKVLEVFLTNLGGDPSNSQGNRTGEVADTSRV
jgi:hypothetical protein